MTNKSAMQCFVSGKVQGVWFRASTKRQAEQLGITGFARNLPDGRVEVIACGDEAALRQLHAWLKQGPELAEVSELTHEIIEWKAYPGFNVL